MPFGNWTVKPKHMGPNEITTFGTKPKQMEFCNQRKGQTKAGQMKFGHSVPNQHKCHLVIGWSEPIQGNVVFWLPKQPIVIGNWQEPAQLNLSLAMLNPSLLIPFILLQFTIVTTSLYMTSQNEACLILIKINKQALFICTTYFLISIQ